MATQDDFDLVLKKLEAKRVGSSWMARCPAHEDKTPSMSVAFENGKILYHCHAGCTQEALLQHFKPIEIAHYSYTDEKGKLLYQVVRYDRAGEKQFTQRKPVANGEDGKWSNSVVGVRRVLYHLPEVAAAQLVVLLEGERDVETARALGFTATTNAMGAGKWQVEYSEQLRKKDVVIIPDNDEPGEQHLRRVARELKNVAASIKVARVPTPYKDLSEWGPNVDAFSILVKYAAEEYKEEPKNWRELFHTFEEFEQARPLSFAIEGFLQHEALTAVCGLSGHGKTFLALSIAKALLRGSGQLWKTFRVVEQAERVVYLVPESTLTPFKHRLKLMGLYGYLKEDRLLVRTLTKGRTPQLDNEALLWASHNAYVIVDTAIRFLEEGTDDNSAAQMANTLSEDLLGLLRAGALAVLPLFHSPKEFRRAEVMTLENMIRGTGELGAVLATAWGVKQIDRQQNILHIENVKPRDFEPCEPFELIGRPWINEEQDFQLYKAPGECGQLYDEQPEMSPKANDKKSVAKRANLAFYMQLVEQNPQLGYDEIQRRFLAKGVNVKLVTLRGYASELRRQNRRERE